LESSTPDDSSGPPDQLNYFNYFTEVEDEFVRRRGKHMLISALDWALVESWKNAGIPLHIVLRAINEAFDAYDGRADKHRRVNSIFYCQQQVESAFADYRTSQVGGEAPAAEEPTKPKKKKYKPDEEVFPKDVLFEFLNRCDEELAIASTRASQGHRTQLEESIKRARSRLKEIVADLESTQRLNAEALERDLDAVDRMILDSARASLSDDETTALRSEAESNLRSYRKKMDKAIYQQTVQNYIARRLRETNHIPRISLFYL
jgi:hypothetical protein